MSLRVIPSSVQAMNKSPKRKECRATNENKNRSKKKKKILKAQILWKKLIPTRSKLRRW
jgi:uncharacterized protein YoxC